MGVDMRSLHHCIIRLSLIGVLVVPLYQCGGEGPVAPAPSVSSSGTGVVTTTGTPSDTRSDSDVETRSDPATESNGDTGSPEDTNTTVGPRGLTAAEWPVVYDGEGAVVFDTDGILMTPKAATAAGETHAALLLSQVTLTQPLQNFKATITYTNVSQLRTGSAPNAWEVFWVFFNYALDGVGKKKTNYVLVKPSGIEIGKAFDEVGQEFLLTNATPTIQIGTPYTLTITKNGPHVTILLDGVLAADFESAVAPKDLYDVPGAIGLYSEDAQVRVSSVVIEALP